MIKYLFLLVFWTGIFLAEGNVNAKSPDPLVKKGSIGINAGIKKVLAKESDVNLKSALEINAGIKKVLAKKSDINLKSTLALKHRLFASRIPGNKNAMAREVEDSLGYIKNIAILGRTSEISGESLLSELSDSSEKLKPLFGEMARYMRMGDKKDALAIFAKKTGLPIGIGEILTGWDELPPSEVTKTVDAYISMLREERKTARKKKDELISDLVYFPVVLNCMMVLLNFVNVAFFIEQREALSLFV